MRKKQRGQGAWETLLWIACVMLAIWAWAPDFVPAEEADIQAVATAAQPNDEARRVLADMLKATPNPTRGELRKVRKKVNEILVTAKSREVTGDKTLQSPTQRAQEQAERAEARLVQIEAKALADMDSEELSIFIASKWNYFVFALAMIAVVWFGFRSFMSAQRSY